MEGNLARKKTNYERARLSNPYKLQKVIKAFCSIDSTRSCEPHGFSIHFFKSAWPVIGEAVPKAVFAFSLMVSYLKN